MNPSLHKVVGIDLGTTYSVVAAYNRNLGRTVPILNTAVGDGLTTASVIGLDPVTRKAVVGMWAKYNGGVDPLNTVTEIKREMGAEFSEDTLRKFNAARVGMRVSDPVKVFFGGHWVLPQEISAFTLMRMKQVAEEEIGEEIRDAVVTVPAYFKEPQKKATREAALLAGLYPRQLIPEPTAAAICYAVDRQEMEKQVYLVYDLGGGTFDVSIIEMEGLNGQVIATDGDMRLGGGNFDDAITAYVIDQLQHQYHIPFHRLPEDRVAQEQVIIKLRAEEAKIRLSSVMETVIDLKDRFPHQTPQIRLTRAKYEELIKGYLKKSLSCVESVIEQAAKKKTLRREDINAILLVGGSSKMPCVKTLLLDYFQKGEDFIRADADPDMVVARGAAILARSFEPSPPPFDIRRPMDNAPTTIAVEDQAVVRLITEHSLGVEVLGRRYVKIVDQGTNIPVEVRQDGFTNAGPTTEIIVNVFQGEGQYVDTCTQIGVLPIPVEPLPPNQHQFAVTFALDVNGLLTMTVHHLNARTGEKKDWPATFDQKTGVGGVEALAAMHNRLVRMFAGTASSSTLPQPVPPGQAEAPPPGTQPHGPWPSVPYGYPPPPGPMPPPPAPDMPGAAPMSGTTGYPPGVAPVPGWPSQPPPGMPAGTPSPASPQAQTVPAGAAACAIVEPTVEVPPEFAEFKSLVRRARKLLERSPNPQLLQAFNAFATALNTGKSGKELETIGDGLVDAYEDAR